MFIITEAVKEDFIDQHAVSSIKEKLPHVMPVSCYRLGIDGANIVFQSKVSSKAIQGELKCRRQHIHLSNNNNTEPVCIISID